MYHMNMIVLALCSMLRLCNEHCHCVTDWQWSLFFSWQITEPATSMDWALIRLCKCRSVTECLYANAYQLLSLSGCLCMQYHVNLLRFFGRAQVIHQYYTPVSLCSTLCHLLICV